MKRKQLILIILSYIFATTILAPGMSFSSEDRVSGFVQNGYRILDVQSSKDVHQFTVYRGDYIKFKLSENTSSSIAKFPTLNESKPITHDLEATAYFKMKQAGVYPFIIGSIQGQIRVIEYQESKYKELSALEADLYIETYNPIVLDVRTLNEYKRMHLKNSVLIPVQDLQKRIKELGNHKNDTILVYCATGNRSTVASKILIDSGFTKILNLKRGISDWVKNHYSVEQ